LDRFVLHILRFDFDFGFQPLVSDGLTDTQSPPWIWPFLCRFNVPDRPMTQNIPKSGNYLLEKIFAQSRFLNERRDAWRSCGSWVERVYQRTGGVDLVAVSSRFDSQRFDRSVAIYRVRCPARFRRCWLSGNYLDQEDSPRQNAFLISLCWVSLNSAIKATTAENGHATD
jgi:hypothetical protein